MDALLQDTGLLELLKKLFLPLDVYNLLTVLIALAVYSLNRKINNIDSGKPYFVVDDIKTDKNESRQPNWFPFIRVIVFNPAKFDTTVYPKIRNIFYRDITKNLVTPRSDIDHAVVKSNNHSSLTLELYINPARKFKNHLFFLVLEDVRKRKIRKLLIFRDKK